MSQIAKVRLMHNADKTKLVPEDHPDASFLYASPGTEIPDSACELYGLVDGDLPAAKLTAAEKKALAEAEKKAAADAAEAAKKDAAEAEAAKQMEGANMDDQNNNGAGTGDAAASAGEGAADDAVKEAAKGEDKAADQGADKAIKPADNKASGKAAK